MVKKELVILVFFGVTYLHYDDFVSRSFFLSVNFMLYWIVLNGVNGPHFFMSYSIDRHFGYFQFMLIIAKAALNIVDHVPSGSMKHPLGIFWRVVYPDIEFG